MEILFMRSYTNKRYGVLISLVLAALLIFVPSAHAANNLFVSDSSGSDAWFGVANNCTLTSPIGLPAPPCKTVEHAVSQASGGDTIHLSGTFNEFNIFLNKNLTIVSGTIDANHNGRHFTVGSGRVVTLDGVYLKDGSATNGGSINNEGILTIEGGAISNSTAAYGGAIYNGMEGEVWVDGSTFSSNWASVDGGAIFNEGEFYTENFAWFSSNSAEQFGGTLYNTEFGEMAFNQTTVVGGSAASGGAIYNMEGVGSISDSTIDGSTAVDIGGAIANVQGSFNIWESTLKENSARDGGAVFNISDGDTYFMIFDSLFSANTATGSGGALFDISTNKSWSINYSDFIANHADERGGALYLLGNGQLTINGNPDGYDSWFERNTAVLSGGAIYGEVDLTIKETTFAENVGLKGGGIYSTNNGSLNIERTAFIENSANFNGGGIFDDSLGDLRMANSTFSANSAGTTGGALHYSGNLAQLANVTIYGNNAGNGGGVYAQSHVAIHNSIITLSTNNDCVINSGGSFSGKRNLIDDHAAGDCSSMSLAAVTHIDPNLTGAPATHAINGLSNAYDNGRLNCPDPLNGFAPLTVDQQNNTRVGVNVPCDIGAFELH
jgi:predicted outer membrane repeat protein